MIFHLYAGNGVVHVVDAYTAFMKPSSPLSVLHGTEKCSTKRRDASSTVKIGCESHIKKEPEEFGQMTPKKRKSIEKGREKSTKRGKMFSSPSKEQNSNDSGVFIFYCVNPLRAHSFQDISSQKFVQNTITYYQYGLLQTIKMTETMIRTNKTTVTMVWTI